MSTQSRASQLPDLIYREFRRQRIRESREHLRSAELLVPERLRRLTLFTTLRCNLRCQYCHTIQPASQQASPETGADYTLPRFRALLDRLSPAQIDHLHFTGGEATLVSDLPEMAALAREHSIPCSLTTNGTASAEVFRRLVDAGLHEIRISCDSHIPELFDQLVQRPGAHQRVLNTVRELVRLRDEEGQPLYLIINLCVGPHNQHQLVECVRHFIRLGPDDVKLIPMLSQPLPVSQQVERHRILNELEELLTEWPAQRFPLLRRKLATVFDEFTWGLTDPNAKRLMRHCFVPLAERTVAGDQYYACPVYVREGGAPLGRLDDDDFRAQQQRSLAFARGDSCIADALCRQNCINCLKRFNLEANVHITGQMRVKTGAYEPITALLEYPGQITRAEVWTHLEQIAQERQTFPTTAPYRPFLIIKPSGLTFERQILEVLASHHIPVETMRPIPDWNAAAMRLYSIPLTERRVFFGLLMARALPLIEGTSRGVLLLLAGDASVERLAQIKRDVRAMLPPSNAVVVYQDDVYCISHGYLHSPDSEQYAVEAGVLLESRR
jgi:molybdenum cofactor biosynthesis enzyme MoaA/NAD-dependent dihydropyrimidine dehydrogenase PreA subunit